MTRPAAASILLALVCLVGCRQPPIVQASAGSSAAAISPEPSPSHVGFDRNLYPGDDRLAALRRHFDFAGFWITPPPGATTNTWTGKRPQLLQAGFGFLILANGRLDAQIKAAQSKGAKLSPAALGQEDAADAIASARREGFPPGAILFLDQEEGGRLLPEQAAYFFAWTEAIAASPFRPGSYLSGQPDPDGAGPDGKPAFITTAQDVREHIAAAHLHDVTLWVYQDACPPAPGCTAKPPAIASSGTPSALVWQYAQSPRRPELTRACAATYAQDNGCYAGASSDLTLDLDAANSADPSHGR